jgi:hypothetical protein
MRYIRVFAEPAEGVRQHELDRLEIADRAAELHALGRVGVGDLRRADGGAEAVGGDLQPRLDEPALGELGSVCAYLRARPNDSSARFLAI